MKRLLFSMALFFAFTTTAQGEFLPGLPEGETSTYDFYGNITSLPSTASIGNNFQVDFIVYADDISMYGPLEVELLMNHGGSGDPFQLLIYPNQWMTNAAGVYYKNCTINFTIPSGWAGQYLSFGHLKIDPSNGIQENDEGNNNLILPNGLYPLYSL